MYLRMLLGVIRTHPFRVGLTCISLAAAFLLFGVLQGIGGTMQATLGKMLVDRLLVGRRFETSIPRVYADRIARVPGVTALTWTQFMFGHYGDGGDDFPIIFTDPDTFFAVRPEFRTSPLELAALRSNRSGLLVLDTLAKKFNLHVGQHIVVTGVPRQDGRVEWERDIVGLISFPENPSQIGFSVGNYAPYDEARSDRAGSVDRFVIRIKDPSKSVEMARTIDSLFISSAAPTRTQAENEYGQSQFAAMGDIGRLSTWILSAVFGAMLILTGNVVMQSVVDRRAEFAMLKALGYSRGRITAIIFFEALALCVGGAAVGLALAYFLYPPVSELLVRVNVAVGHSPLPPRTIAVGLLCAVLLAVVSALVPGIGMRRMEPSAVLNSRA